MEVRAECATRTGDRAAVAWNTWTKKDDVEANRRSSTRFGTRLV